MVFPLIALGIMAALGHGVNHAVKEYEIKKGAESRTIQAMTKAPEGYAPQPALLFDFALEHGEELIATFSFTPCKWKKEVFAENKMFPAPFATTLGIGHVTTHRVLLMYDLKRIEKKGWWSSGEVNLVGQWAGNIIHHTINESVGKLFENLAHEDAKTRQHMERIAKYVPKGVVSCQRGGDWGLANGCVFFKMDGYEGVNYPMTFGPSFIDDDASGNEIEIFKKIMQFGPASADIEKRNTMPWYGSREGLESFVM